MIWKIITILSLIISTGTTRAAAEPVPQNLPVGQKIFLPMVIQPVVQTPFGAFLDAQTADNGLAEMQSANVSWVHLPFAWKTVEAQAGQRNWKAVSNFENNLRTAASQNINAIIYIQDTPDWALKAGFICGAVAPDKFQDLGRFLTDMVTRYSAPPYNVKYFELWSEPDVSGFLGCWGDPSDPNYYGGGYYGEMIQYAYPIIKAASPSAEVLFGGLMMDSDPKITNRASAHFLEGALIGGAGNSFDGISFHAYDYYQRVLGQYYNPGWNTAWNTTGPAFLAKAAFLRQLLDQYHITGKYLMNTELAVLCGSTGLEAPCLTDDHQKTLASYIVQAYAAGIADNIRANVWFSVAGWRGSALLDSNQKPLPAYWAFQNARDRLGTASYVRTITEFNGVFGYEFSQDKHRIWVLWSISESSTPHDITLGSIPLAVYDMYGNDQTYVSTSPNIGYEPVFIEFETK